MGLIAKLIFSLVISVKTGGCLVASIGTYTIFIIKPGQLRTHIICIVPSNQSSITAVRYKGLSLSLNPDFLQVISLYYSLIINSFSLVPYLVFQLSITELVNDKLLTVTRIQYIQSSGGE